MNNDDTERTETTATAPGSTDSYAILGEALRDGCLELMRGYGLSPTIAAPSANPSAESGAVIATVDFFGQDLRGTIGLSMTSSVVVETYRAALGVAIRPDSSEGTDWTCELVNQLIGRVMNKLRAYNVGFTVNTPRKLVSVPTLSSEGVLRNRFVCDQGSFAGYLDVLLAPGFALVNAPPVEPLAQEGDLVLF